MNRSTRALARAGVLAALYVVLTLAVFPIASGAIQFRLSEALTLLPLLFPEAVPASAGAKPVATSNDEAIAVAIAAAVAKK